MSATDLSRNVSTPASEEVVKRRIVNYYNHMDFLYEHLWAGQKSLGFHYGFWEDQIKNRQAAIINENRRIAEKLGLTREDLVLDAGCGICGSSIWMAENYGCKATGITLSEQQVRNATAHIKKRKVDHLVKAEARDFCHTGYTGEMFTKIFAIESVCCAFSKEAFVKEAFRLLKPGGRLAVADGFLLTHEMDAEKKRVVDEFCQGWGLPNCVTGEEFEAYLRKAGFTNVQSSDMTKAVIPSARSIWRLNVPFYPPFKALCSLKILPRYI